MTQHQRLAAGPPRKARPPFWSEALRALRLSRGVTQEGWAAQLGYGRATIRRWESGASVPSADAEAAIIALCCEKSLFRHFAAGPLAGEVVSPEWIANLLAAARHGHEPPRVSPPNAHSPPPVRYALSGDTSIAYQVFGDGPIDLVVTPGAVSHRELDWEHPGAVQFYRQLGSFARVVTFDKRGSGLSDRADTGTIEERMADILAVMDAVGMKRAALFGITEGGPVAIELATTRPERISTLILFGTDQRLTEYLSPQDHHAQLERLRSTWGTADSGFLERFGPSVAADPAAQAWWGRYLRISASPGAVISLKHSNDDIDVRSRLPSLNVPTLVLHRTGDRVIDIAEGFKLSERIPNARFIALPGDDHLPWLGDVESITGAVSSFLSDTDPSAETHHVLAAVLAAEPVNIEKRGQQAREDHRNTALRKVFRWRGTVMPTDGESVLAMFDSPSRAIRCASAIRNATRSPYPGFRTGVHVGEVHLDDGRAAGPVVEAGKCVARSAAPGEVLASEIAVELTAATDIAFTPRLTGAVVAGFQVFAVER